MTAQSVRMPAKIGAVCTLTMCSELRCNLSHLRSYAYALNFARHKAKWVEQLQLTLLGGETDDDA